MGEGSVVERASADQDTRVIATARLLSGRVTNDPEVTEIEIEETHFVKGTPEVGYRGRVTRLARGPPPHGKKGHRGSALAPPKPARLAAGDGLCLCLASRSTWRNDSRATLELEQCFCTLQLHSIALRLQLQRAASPVAVLALPNPARLEAPIEPSLRDRARYGVLPC